MDTGWNAMFVMSSISWTAEEFWRISIYSNLEEFDFMLADM